MREVPATIEDEVIMRDLSTEVRESLATLTDDERQAVSLAYFEGHSYREVAVMLDEPEGTVKSRIRSGLAKLRTATVAGVMGLL